jgi:tetratricopeptide (TPR) repeat protein
MGCYGIGISRIMAAVAEQYHDDDGLTLPPQVAPYEAVVIATNMDQPAVVETAEGLYESLEQWEKLSALAAREAGFAATPEEAVKLLRQAAGILATKRGDHAGAAELLDRATQLRPDDRELMLELCDRYSASGRGKAAAQVLEKIVASYGPKKTKELGEIHRRLANAYLAEAETQKALEELDKAFRIEPGNVGVLTQLGEVAMKVGDHKKAQQMYRALLLQKLDEAGPIKKSFVFMRLGEIHEALGEKPKAMQMYERAVQTDGLPEAKTKLDALKAAT